ncbi:MAG: hypothetical protein AAFQ42_05895 [Pseudomonadota bacterium]
MQRLAHSNLLSGLWRRLPAVALLAATVATIDATHMAAFAGDGVRIHRLMTPDAAAPRPAAANPARATSRKPAIVHLMRPEPSRAAPAKSATAGVPHHNHRIRLHAGQRVTVVFRNGLRRGDYRDRLPGARRPWAERRHGTRRAFQNQRGLYQSNIYRRSFR